MNHLQKFEAFLIPKPVRKFMPFWSDEDIALQVLKELKEMKDNYESTSKLGISEEDDNWYSFDLDGYQFSVRHYLRMSRGGVYDSGELKMGDNYLTVSNEVCKQIKDIIHYIFTTDERELKDFDKKDFRISRNLR